VIAPEIAYRFQYQRDVAGPTFEIFHRNITASATSVTVVGTLGIVPLNKILVLSNFVIFANPGATQAIDSLRLSIFGPAGAETNVWRFVTPGTADADVAETWQGEVFIFGRRDAATNIQVRGNFDAGVNSNVIQVGLSGVVIPRGNAAAF